MLLFLVVFLGLVTGGVLGTLLARALMGLLREIKVSNDKQRIKIAMKEEAYLNQLYEECLCEEMDDIARRAANEMNKKRRR